MPGVPRVLRVRQLNRALLHRQHLLRRSKSSVVDVLEHLVGLQAQAPAPPYVGLWTRLSGFEASDLSALIETKRVVRLALMRSTIHLVSSEDAQRIRPTVQPVLERGVTGSYGRALAGVDLAGVAEAGRRLVEQQPLTYSAMGETLQAEWPGVSPSALATVVRARHGLVQVPPRGLWGRSGAAAHTTLEHWLGPARVPPIAVRDLVRRYLAAFGPATVRDVQVWSGLTRLGEVVQELRKELIVFRSETGAELFDLPDAPRPRAGTRAPARFLPEFDNVLLSHQDRSRIVDDRFRSLLVLGGMVRGSVLVDGFVRGTWGLERSRRTVRLVVEPFEEIALSDRIELEDEGGRLLQFMTPDVPDREVAFLAPVSW